MSASPDLSRLVTRTRRKAFNVSARVLSTASGSRTRYVMVFGHVRSGSTLLTHLLSSSEHITGYGEMFIRYTSHKDLWRLYLRTCRLTGRPFLRARFVVDQLNHDKYVQPEVLASLPLDRAVFLIREPRRSLASMVKLFGPGGLRDKGWTERDALAYYEARLETLTRYAAELQTKRSLLVEYDRLTSHSEEVLEALTRFFELPTALSSHYQSHLGTGKISDPSSNITAGKIIRTAPHESVTISDAVLARADDAYTAQRHRLMELCSDVA